MTFYGKYFHSPLGAQRKYFQHRPPAINNDRSLNLHHVQNGKKYAKIDHPLGISILRVDEPTYNDQSFKP